MSINRKTLQWMITTALDNGRTNTHKKVKKGLFIKKIFFLYLSLWSIRRWWRWSKKGSNVHIFSIYLYYWTTENCALSQSFSVCFSGLIGFLLSDSEANHKERMCAHRTLATKKMPFLFAYFRFFPSLAFRRLILRFLLLVSLTMVTKFFFAYWIIEWLSWVANPGVWGGWLPFKEGISTTYFTKTLSFSETHTAAWIFKSFGYTKTAQNTEKRTTTKIPSKSI